MSPTLIVPLPFCVLLRPLSRACFRTHSFLYCVRVERCFPHLVHRQALITLTRPVSRSSGRGRCIHSCRSCRVRKPHRLHGMMRVSGLGLGTEGIVAWLNVCAKSSLAELWSLAWWERRGSLLCGLALIGWLGRTDWPRRWLPGPDWSRGGERHPHRFWVWWVCRLSCVQWMIV